MDPKLNDDVLASGNEEQIEDALEDMEIDDSVLFGDEDDDEDFDDNGDDNGDDDDSDETAEATDVVDGSQPEVIDTTKAQGSGDQGTEDRTVKQNTDNVKEIDGKLYIAVDATNSQVLSKDGKHSIPYDVLERARNGSAEAQARIAELMREKDELNNKYQTVSKKQQIAEKQLTDAGIDVEKLPEEVLNDPEALQRIRDELPGEAGQLLEALVARYKSESQNQAPKQEAPAEQGVHPVTQALASEELKELSGWQQNDTDRWDMALIIDKQLQNNPEFSQLPIEQRFAEVQRRTKLAFGDPVQEGINQELADQEQREQKAKQPAQEPAKQPVPNSPSDISGGGRNMPMGHQALAEQDAVALESAMARMSDAEIEALLEEAGGAFE